MQLQQEIVLLRLSTKILLVYLYTDTQIQSNMMKRTAPPQSSAMVGGGKPIRLRFLLWFHEAPRLQEVPRL